MGTQRIPTIKFLFNQDWKALTDAAPDSEIESFSSPQELLTFLESNEVPALIFCSLNSKQDLLHIATLLKLSRKLTKEIGLKIAVVNFSGNKQFEIAAQKIGVQEIIDPAVNFKSLRFKLTLWKKGLSSQTSQSTLKLKNVQSSEQVKNQPEKKPEDKLLQYLPAMKSPDDIWLINREFECKKILGRWLVRMMGPSPYVANWVEVENKPNFWRFEFREGNGVDFISGTGSWFFRGDQKPDFNWKENIWYMTGENLDLFYFDKEVEPRLQLKDKKLSLSTNSSQALAKEKLILESFDKDLVFKKDVERMGKMEGKGKSERLMTDPLSHDLKNTKNEFEEEVFGNLKGSIKESSDEKPKTATKTQERSEYVATLKTEENKEAKEFSSQHLKDLGGKTKTEHLQQGKLGGKVKSDDLDIFSEKKKEASEDSRQGLSAKKAASPGTEEDVFGRKPGKKESHGAASLNDFGGKTTSDDLGSSSYGGKLSSQKAPQQVSAEEKKNTPSIAQEMDDLFGKGKTDHLKQRNLHGKAKPVGDMGSDPLSLKLNEQQKEKQKEKASKGFKEEDKSGYSGKGKTDHFNNRDLSGKQKGEGDIGTDPLQMKLKPEEKKPGAYGGKSSTDHLKNSGQKGPASAGAREGSLLDYGNKNHTHETKYKGHLEAEKFEGEEGRKNQYRKADEYNDLGGKTSTEKIAKHYGAREIEREESQKDSSSGALSGRTVNSTDKLESHLHGEKAGAKSAPAKEGRRQEGLTELMSESADILPFSKTEFDFAALEALKQDLQGPKDPELDEITQTAVVKAFLRQGKVSTTCDFDDYFDQTIIFQVPADHIQVAEVEVSLSLHYQGEVKKIKLNGNVTSSEQVEDTSFISVEVKDREIKELDAFLDIYRTRQQHATTFLQKVKGL